MYKIKRLGQNLIIIKNQERPFTIVLPKDYNFDKIFSLAYRANEDIKVATTLLEKEINKYIKAPEKNKEVLDKRIEKRKIEKKIKEIQGFDYSSLPIGLNSDWLNVLNSQQDNQHIKNFLLLLSLNPNKFTRDNLLNRLSSKFPYITSMGYLVLTRQIWSVKQGDELYDFIQSSYTKIKGQKKGVKNYGVYFKDKKYIVSTTDPDIKEKGWDYEGNLSDLYNTYKPENKTVYCSNYNKGGIKQESWNIGDIVKIENPNFEDQICGTERLHVKTSPFSNIGNKDYGDTTVIVLINPRDIISCVEDWKITCSKFKICSIVTDEEIKDTFTQDFQNWDYDYAIEDFEEIKRLSDVVKENSINEYKIEDKKKITELKKSLISSKPSIINTISGDFGKILESRIQMLK